MKIPFVGPSYQGRSAKADQQRTVNCYVELDDASPRAPFALYGTPGKVLRLTLPQGPVRGAVTQEDYALVVAGNGVYRVASDYSYNLIGNIGTSSGPVGMVSDGSYTLIVDGIGGWLAGNQFAVITDPDFPNGVTWCGTVDGYFVVAGDGTGQFAINELPGSQSWVGTDFATAEGAPDDIVSGAVTHRELWLFGEKSVEIYGNTGNADFPFERNGSAFIDIGTAALSSVVAVDNSVLWLGKDKNGHGMVYRAQAYNPVVISTRGVERAIQGYSTISDAVAFAYQQEGHTFYVLTFPTASRTWVYDLSTQLWHERAYMDPQTGELSRWRANCHVFFGGEHIVGDYETGKLYALDLDTYTDNGDAIKRLRVTQAQSDPEDRAKLFYSDLVVDMETGTSGVNGATLMMRYWSDSTWSNVKTTSIGASGEYAKQARFTGNLGCGRDRLWEISMTDNAPFAVFGASVHVERGE